MYRACTGLLFGSFVRDVVLLQLGRRIWLDQKVFQGYFKTYFKNFYFSCINGAQVSHSVRGTKAIVGPLVRNDTWLYKVPRCKFAHSVMLSITFDFSKVHPLEIKRQNVKALSLNLSVFFFFFFFSEVTHTQCQQFIFGYTDEKI